MIVNLAFSSPRIGLDANMSVTRDFTSSPHATILLPSSSAISVSFGVAVSSDTVVSSHVEAK
jgi:hypothetical protein